MAGERSRLDAVTTGNPLAAGFRRAPPMATDSKALVLRCLNDAIDRSGVKRGALATDCGVTEGQFSRLTGGSQGFPIALLAALPRRIRVDVLKRLGALDGLQVQDPNPLALDADVRRAIEALVQAHAAHLAAMGE